MQRKKTIIIRSGKKNLLLCMASVFFAQQIAYSTIQPQIAVGGYSATANANYPLILVNQQNEQKWSFVNNISGVPSTLKPLYATSVQCTENFCIATGSGIGLDAAAPYILLSHDKGYSWSYPQSIRGVSPSAFEIQMKTTSCIDDNNCVAGGSYHEILTCNIPLLLSSQDQGKTWSNSKIMNLPNIKYDCVEPRLIKCTDNSCIAVGQYTRNYEFLSNDPLLLTSQDKGKSWSFIKSRKIHDIPTNLKNGNTESIACTGRTCIIGGSYKKDDGTNLLYPMILVTKDSGRSWSFIKNLTKLPGGLNTELDQASCNENVCITVGQIKNNNLNTLLLFKSNDNATTWTQIENLIDYPQNKQLKLISSINCTKQTCVILGEFVDDAPDAELYDSVPFFLVSKDNGNTWEFNQNISGLPSKNNKLSLYQINCTDNICYAVGAIGGNYDYQPLILESTDNGISWKYLSNITNLPSDIINGVLYDLV